MATKEQDQPTELDTGDLLPEVASNDTGELAKLYDHAKSLTVEDPDAVQERILRTMLNSANVGDLLRAGEATPASELYGVPLTFTAIRASESDFVEGPDLYLHVEARIKGNGDAVTVSCGARDVVMKLLLADMRGWFPFDAVIVKSTKATKDGFYPVFLRHLDDNGGPL